MKQECVQEEYVKLTAAAPTRAIVCSCGFATTYSIFSNPAASEKLGREFFDKRHAEHLERVAACKTLKERMLASITPEETNELFYSGGDWNGICPRIEALIRRRVELPTSVTPCPHLHPSPSRKLTNDGWMHWCEDCGATIYPTGSERSVN